FALARTGPRHALSRIDPRTNRVTRTVPLTREYSVIASGPSGLWGAGCLKRLRHPDFECRRAAVHRIDLRTGRPEVALALPAAAEATSVQILVSDLGAGRDAVWVVQPGKSESASSRVSSVLRRVDLSTRKLTTVRTLPREPADLAVGGHGAWVVDVLERIRIDP
ncbi:MAG: hypothetical protein ABR509_04550, partial [Candidatus Limnocylindria bacterium]